MTQVRSRGTSWGSDLAELLSHGHRLGRWEVVEPIGAGGWATVYAGRPAVDGEGPPGRSEVALKVMPTAGLAPRQAARVAEAARREVELGRGAGHPRLVRLLDSLVLSSPGHPALDGAIVLVMERARCSLRDLVDAGTLAGGTDGGGMTEAEGGRLIAGICEGLAHLHAAGWVHADLKPENVLIGEDGSVKLSDFGLATELTGTHGYAQPMGTLDYLPPERWKAPLGELGVEVRPSADIWALGIVIHEVFASGAAPFTGATPMARGAAVQEYAEGRAPLRMDQAVPEFWRALAADCLAPTHAERAAHTAESLSRRIAAHEAGRSAEPEPPPRTAHRGRRARAAAFLAVTVCGAVGAAVWTYAGRDGGPAPGRPEASPAPVRVFNAERGCQDRFDRDPQCSLGLAVDPRRPYTAENVVPTRVWHGDVLEADCELPDGEQIIDEEDRESTRWFRVHLRSGVAREAWLPAVRTKDRPALPRCPHAAS
ncbi:serine/threonine-protein kinase [Streptomyces sp. NBC_00233]|uniref:serine/threonine-protein kinase n=1 Tax=Streptomyces sp. NBC_00233 TaxID=2975686 RepID=UPI00224D1595|nr:serine/threonine-protein kinase [Streptomyces sp. NBC_00233]MCX5230508.1 serine/threonine protein kinase [Streptomyces sp. NBC_00233]